MKKTLRQAKAAMPAKINWFFRSPAVEYGIGIVDGVPSAIARIRRLALA